MKTILRRLREPSTWAGIAALLALFAPQVGEVISKPEVAAALAALAACFLPEK